MAFVKVVEGSEIYNFSIHYFVHFYSTFWSFTCSNMDTATQLGQPTPRRAKPRRRARRPHPACAAPRSARCLDARAPRRLEAPLAPHAEPGAAPDRPG
jgi:hypothetical protein